MRSDMYEVLIERPRGGAGWGRKWQKPNWRCLDQDDGPRDGGPTRQRMKPRCPSKWLSENLQPMVRFLRSRVGRPWDQVYSEMCAHIAVRSAVQKHVLDHVRQYVERNPIFIDGVPHEPCAAGGRYRTVSGYHEGFYVCPQTGLLLAARSKRIRHKDTAQAQPQSQPTSAGAAQSMSVSKRPVTMR